MIDLLTGLASIAALLMIFLAAMALMARMNHQEDDDGPNTILSGIADQEDEPLGDMVDVGGIVKRYTDD